MQKKERNLLRDLAPVLALQCVCICLIFLHEPASARAEVNGNNGLFGCLEHMLEITSDARCVCNPAVIVVHAPIFHTFMFHMEQMINSEL